MITDVAAKRGRTQLTTKRRLSVVLIADMVGYSRLVEADEAGLLARQSHYRQTLFAPHIAASEGRIVKSTGDGVLVEFASIRDAVGCAIDLQTRLAEMEADRQEETKIKYRIGIHAGDVVADGDDLFGDTVNLAARLESLSASGGVCISDAAMQMLDATLQSRFVDRGTQRVKNIVRPVRVWQWTPETRDVFSGLDAEASAQQIGFCTADDGTLLAYATVGTGPTLFKAPNWINHLDFDWKSPLAGPSLARLARHCRLVRFDQRGNGLSDWDVGEISEDAMISDMNCVVKAAGLDRFGLFGQSQGCAFSVRFAVENPDKVSFMILLGGYLRGAMRRGKDGQAARHAATNTLIREGGGSDNPAYRRIFTETMIPAASAEMKASWDERQRLATTPENAARIDDMNAHIDVSHLAPRVSVPTLVCHSEGDRRAPLDEGRRLAALIPGAEFVALPGDNHILTEGSEAFDVFHERAGVFIGKHSDSPEPAGQHSET